MVGTAGADTGGATLVVGDVGGIEGLALLGAAGEKREAGN